MQCSQQLTVCIKKAPPSTCPGGCAAVANAAGCVGVSCRALSVTVILGAHNISAQEQSQQRIRVRQWVIHPKYSHVGFKNDIVLLKLKKKAKINKNVQYISFASRNQHVGVGAECLVSGWGLTDTGSKSDVMMEVKLKVQKEEICQHIFDNYQRQSMICVGDEYSKKSASYVLHVHKDSEAEPEPTRSGTVSDDEGLTRQEPRSCVEALEPTRAIPEYTIDSGHSQVRSDCNSVIATLSLQQQLQQCDRNSVTSTHSDRNTQCNTHCNTYCNTVTETYSACNRVTATLQHTQ
ncbi:Granzyme C [Lonchura striata]|uniref:Granzyme C n=1 Tax=Lonchura striata TaxID=40157 RepID=A0A218U955_9PASE|nr:Granzyme C [Lonchura striata domestica]